MRLDFQSPKGFPAEVEGSWTWGLGCSQFALEARLWPRFSIQCEHTHVLQPCPGANVLWQHLGGECTHLLTLCNLLSEQFPVHPSAQFTGVWDLHLWLLHSSRTFQGRCVFQLFPVPVLPPPGDERNEGLPAISLPSSPHLFSSTKYPLLLQLEGELAASQLQWLGCPMCVACCKALASEARALTLLETQLLGSREDFGKRKQPPLNALSVLHLLGGGNLPWAFLQLLVYILSCRSARMNTGLCVRQSSACKEEGVFCTDFIAQSGYRDGKEPAFCICTCTFSCCPHVCACVCAFPYCV